MIICWIRSLILNYEIERKFIVAWYPEDIHNIQPKKILQGYLPLKNKNLEVRFRQINNKYFQTIKIGNGLKREETEIFLTQKQFEPLWQLTKNYRIEKQRFSIPFGKHVIELDIYENELKGFAFCEIEFQNGEEANSFFPPDWFGQEVTFETSLQNNYLAIHGIKPKVLKKYNLKLKNISPFKQSGVIPIRFQKEQPEILIIQNRHHNKWIFPKGIIEHKCSEKDTAKKEAYEEAGILGNLDKKFGSYTYKKWQAEYHVALYLFNNVIELKKWPEDNRERKWVSVNSLQNFITKKELQPLITNLKIHFNQ